MILTLVKQFLPLRVSEEDEHLGLNIAEHGAESSILELANAMHRATETGDYTEAVKVKEEYGTEVGDLGRSFNTMVDAIQKQQIEIKRSAEAQRERADRLRLRVEEILSVIDAASEGRQASEMDLSGDDAIARLARRLQGFLDERTAQEAAQAERLEHEQQRSESLNQERRRHAHRGAERRRQQLLGRFQG